MRRVCKSYRLQRSSPRKFGYITENGLPHFMCRRGEVGVFVRVCDRTYSYSVQPTNQRRRSLWERVYRKFVWNEARETADGMESMAACRSVCRLPSLSPLSHFTCESLLFLFRPREYDFRPCAPPAPKKTASSRGGGARPFMKMVSQKKNLHFVFSIFMTRKECCSAFGEIQRGLRS